MSGTIPLKKTVRHFLPSRIEEHRQSRYFPFRVAKMVSMIWIINCIRSWCLSCLYTQNGHGRIAFSLEVLAVVTCTAVSGHCCFRNNRIVTLLFIRSGSLQNETIFHWELAESVRYDARSALHAGHSSSRPQNRHPDADPMSRKPESPTHTSKKSCAVVASCRGWTFARSSCKDYFAGP